MLETNMNNVRETAEVFLYVDIGETSIPFVASHPFTSSWVQMLPRGELVDLHDPKAARRWREALEARIDRSDLGSLFALMNRPYILSFLSFVERDLSAEDLGMILGRYWQDIEIMSVDKSMTGERLVRMFKRASKDTLMEEDEKVFYNSLPDEVTIYRGVTGHNRRNKRALSWTTEKDVAKWFANRFDTGTGEVWTLNVPKERILCAFSGRGEKEVIVDLYRYEGVKQMTIEKI